MTPGERQPDAQRALRAQAAALEALRTAARELLAAGVSAGLCFRVLVCSVTLATVEAQGAADPEPTRRELEDQLARIRHGDGRGSPNVVAMPTAGDALLPEMAAATRSVDALEPRKSRWWRRGRRRR